MYFGSIQIKYKNVLKKYQDWSCNYQDRNEQWMKH